MVLPDDEGLALRFRLLLVALLALALAAGCTRYAPPLVDAGGLYDTQSAKNRLDVTSVARYQKTPVADAPALRTKALAGLRGEGAVGTQAADLITKSFPPDTPAVPVYVEKARFMGRPSWLIIEAYGPGGGNLEHKRLWVMSESGELLFSAAAK